MGDDVMTEKQHGFTQNHRRDNDEKHVDLDRQG